MALAMTAGTEGYGYRQVFLSHMAPLGADRTLAILLVGVSAVIFAILTPFAKVELAPIPAFIPAYQAALFYSDMITAAVLYSQYSIQRTRSLLVLGTAYLFTALAIVPHTLSFPGLFGVAGFIGSGPQTTVWLYMMWHAGFPLMIMAYALIKQDERPLDSKGEGPRLAGEITGARKKRHRVRGLAVVTGNSLKFGDGSHRLDRFNLQSSSCHGHRRQPSGPKREQRKASKQSQLRGENPRGPARLANRAVMNLFVNAQGKRDRAERRERHVKRQAVPARTRQERNSGILEEQDVRAGEWACAKARPPLIPKPKEERNRCKDSNAGAGRG